jgi:esterase/lipase superfamily enzyme
MYWLITNRNETADGFGGGIADVTYWTAPAGADPKQKVSWTKLKDEHEFQTKLVIISNQFPHPLAVEPESQKHVTLLVHGFNDAWTDAMGLYQSVVANLYSVPDSLGECIAFDWPSKGSVLGYLPDRADARRSAQALSDVLSDLYDWLLDKQRAAAADPMNACRAKTSIIAHSMGNYVFECAMNYSWTQKNRPLLVSLIDEVLMVAADVDNDLFRSGEVVGTEDGEGIANLCYRVTALYTGHDAVLGASAGLKHFGKRRLGRSGLDPNYPVPDNVWEIDCTNLISVTGIKAHSAYFHPDESKCYPLMRSLLQGVDRSILVERKAVPSALVRQQRKV